MSIKKIYMVGIKGVGMTALAIYLKEMGFKVSGSDVPDLFQTDAILLGNAIPVVEGFSPENVPSDADLVVVTGAHGGMTNPEAQYSKKSGIDTVMLGEAVGKFTANKRLISVSGSHGKTTTSAMIANILVGCGKKPSYLIGCASVSSLGNAGHYSPKDLFVCEADEYMTCPVTDKTPRFLWQNPENLIITGIEFDHPDAFTSLQDVKNAFMRFTRNIKKNGTLIVCIDNKNVQDLIHNIPEKHDFNIITYGFSSSSDYVVSLPKFSNQNTRFHIDCDNQRTGEIILKIPGEHNCLNAAASYIAAKVLNIDEKKIIDGLYSFTGTKRRFEKIATENHITFYDDYAHHPSEISATLKSARAWFPDRRLIVIFQPHTFSRTKALFKDFAACFNIEKSFIIIPDIYKSAREQSDSSINSAQLVHAISKNRNNVVYVTSKDECLKFLKNMLRKDDIIFTMGAGDISMWQSDIITCMKKVRG